MRLVVAKGEEAREEGRTGSLGLVMETVTLRMINNRVLYSAGNYIQFLGINL